MNDFNIGSLKILGTGVTDYIVQTPLEGFESPDYRTTEYENPGEDGGTVSSQQYGMRAMSIPGIIKGNDPTQYESNRRALSSAMALKRDAFASPVPTRLTWTTLAGSSYFIDAYPKKPLFNYADVNNTRFLLQFTADDPTIYGSTLVSSGAIVRASGGGFILPVVFPIVSSAAIGGTATVANAGNAPSKPTVTFTGPLTNPYLLNNANSKYMQLNYTIPSGSFVTINMANKTIMLNGVSSILSTKADGSSWFEIEPGNNILTFSTGSSSDTGSALVEFYPGYLTS